MIVVVYSGSRFADWRIADKGRIVSGFKTMGINPHHNNEQFINQLLHKNNSLINYAEKIKRIYFFGAGASTKFYKEVVSKAFSGFFRYGKVYVYHDLQAAGIATCGDHPGLVGIMGSGSNLGYFNGKRMEANNFGLGYILADEGSANWLGRSLLRAYMTDSLPGELRGSLQEGYRLDRKVIMDKVYHQPNPALFLSSFSDFVFEHKDHPFLQHLIQEGFHLYFDTYFNQIPKKYEELPVHFTGTIASDYQDLLRSVAKEHGIGIGTVIKEPIHNLLNYYINKNR